MYVIFIILLWNYEKAVHKNLGSSGRDCVLIILYQHYGRKTGLFEICFFWVGQYEVKKVKVKKPPKLKEIVKTKEVKIHIFWDLMNFDEIFWERYNLDDIKSD